MWPIFSPQAARRPIPVSPTMHHTRIIHVCLGLELGGMENLLIEFAARADRNRFDLHFVSLTTKGPAADAIERLGWPVIAMHQRPGLNPTLPLALTRLFLRLRPDVVHTHNTKPMLYAAPAARVAGVRAVIHTRHGQRHGATRRQTFLFNLAAKCVDQIVSVSADSTRRAQLQGLSPDRTTTILNGIDTSRFPAAGPCPTGPAVFVGRLSPEKDIPTLLRAAAIVAKDQPSFRLHLIGAGPILPELQHATHALGLRDRVQFLGSTTDVSAALAGASLFVLPSLTEGISLALLEAMASAIPVVATDVGGNREVVLDHETGLLAPPSLSDAIAAAILNLYTQPARARLMGLAGRRRVEAEFDSRQMVARYESLYVRTLQSRRSAAAA
jgi:glycosyltransferase involved in cell wall biosynthesis